MERETTRNSFLQRLIGAAALDPAIYEEVEADRAATGQALAVVLLFCVAAGIGASGFSSIAIGRVGSFAVIALLAWAAWALVTFEIGVRLFPEPQTRSDPGELMRTLGFSATPGLLLVFGYMPAVTAPVFAVVAVWMLISMIVAVRHALDYTRTARAIAVCVLGWVLALVIAIVMGIAFGPTVS